MNTLYKYQLTINFSKIFGFNCEKLLDRTSKFAWFKVNVLHRWDFQISGHSCYNTTSPPKIPAQMWWIFPSHPPIGPLPLQTYVDSFGASAVNFTKKNNLFHIKPHVPKLYRRMYCGLLIKTAFFKERFPKTLCIYWNYSPL